MRPTCSLVALFFACSITRALLAQEDVAPASSAKSEKQRMMVINWNAPLGTNSRATVTADLGELVTISQHNGDFRWVLEKQAWIHQKHVMQPDEAIARFSNAIESNPTAEAFQNRGIGLSSLNKDEAAINDLNEAVRRDAKISAIYINRGNVYRKLGSLSKAIQDYSKAIEIDPKDARAFNSCSLVFADLRDFEKAIIDSTAAIKLDPGNAGAYNNRGVSWREQGNFDKAIADYNRAIELAPNDASAYGNRGYAHKQKGDYAAAVTDYVAAIELNPRIPETLNDLAWLLATCPKAAFRDPKKSVELATRACVLTEYKDWNLLDTLAASFAANKRFDDATKWARIAIEKAPKDQHESIQANLDKYEKKKALFEN